MRKKPFSLKEYYLQAHNRAKRRKSPWNLLLIPMTMIPVVTIWALSILGAEALHQTMYPGQDLADSKGIGTILVSVSPLGGSLPLGMVIGNFIVRLLPPARRTLDTEATPFQSTDFTSQQKRLIIVSLVMVPLSAILTIIGTLLPWYD